MKFNKFYDLIGVFSVTCCLSVASFAQEESCEDFNPYEIKTIIKPDSQLQECIKWMELKHKCLCEKQCDRFYDVEDDYYDLCT